MRICSCRSMGDTVLAGGKSHLKYSSETKLLLDMVCGRGGMVFRCRVEPTLPFRRLGFAGGGGVGAVSSGGDVFEEARDCKERLTIVGSAFGSYDFLFSAP